MEKNRLGEIAFYLHQLKNPRVFEEVKKAIANIDKEALQRKMMELKIPAKYRPVLLTIIFTSAYLPMQKWPFTDP